MTANAPGDWILNNARTTGRSGNAWNVNAWNGNGRNKSVCRRSGNTAKRQRVNGATSESVESSNSSVRSSAENKKDNRNNNAAPSSNDWSGRSKSNNAASNSNRGNGLKSSAENRKDNRGKNSSAASNSSPHSADSRAMTRNSSPHSNRPEISPDRGVVSDKCICVKKIIKERASLICRKTVPVVRRQRV